MFYFPMAICAVTIRVQAILLLLLLYIATWPLGVSTLEPITITTGIAVSTAFAASALFACYDHARCKYYECCTSNWVKPNISALNADFERRLYGQHLVANRLLPALRSHFQPRNAKSQPSKALAVSLHGMTGSGKNFVSRLVAENLFVRGMDSENVHLLVGTLHFPHADQVAVYKEQLRSWIKGNVTRCPRSLFIFDEMDKMPNGLVDALTPFLDFHTNVDGVDFRRSTFLFLSNLGSSDINKYVLDQWNLGRKREDIDFHEVEALLTRSSYNSQGGLWHSNVIERHLVSAFIPFLPLERFHVRLCIRDELRLKRGGEGGGLENDTHVVEKVLEELMFFPSDKKLFSSTGCKRVSDRVNFVLESLG